MNGEFQEKFIEADEIASCHMGSRKQYLSINFHGGSNQGISNYTRFLRSCWWRAEIVEYTICYIFFISETLNGVCTSLAWPTQLFRSIVVTIDRLYFFSIWVSLEFSKLSWRWKISYCPDQLRLGLQGRIGSVSSIHYKTIQHVCYFTFKNCYLVILADLIVYLLSL